MTYAEKLTRELNKFREQGELLSVWEVEIAIANAESEDKKR